jgi:UDP-2,3-diacylglucosamine pyrophosphatase LpxH
LAWSEFAQATVSGNTKDELEAAKSRMNALRDKLLFELDRWHGRSCFRPKPDDTIRILLLADVQFGDPATDPAAPFAEHLIARALRRDGTLPDLIAIAGDVSHSGRPDQFAIAEERFAIDLMGQLWRNNNVDNFRDRIVLVPGNHDVNLRFSACDNRKFNLSKNTLDDDTKPVTWKKSYPYLFHHDYAIEPFRRFARRLTKDRNWEDSSDLSWVDRRFLHCGIRFFVLNSVVKLNATNPDKACLNEDTLSDISRSLGADDPESIFSIALSHHGLRPEGGSVDEKAVDDWSSVGCDFFFMHRIRLWLYGHYHKFAARSINDEPFDNSPLWLLQTPTSRIGTSTRGFCLLELSRTDGKVMDANVHYYVLENNNAEKRTSRRVFDKG